jgi:hypothetical protein
MPVALLRALLPSLILVPAFGACSGNAATAPSSVAARADLSTATPCATLTNDAESAIAEATAAATSHLACSTDADCAVGAFSSSCSFGCSPPITTRAGATALQETIERLNATTCATFAEKVCPPPAQPACDSFVPTAACVEGTCTSFPPAAWESFSIEEGNDPESLPLTCAPGGSCTLWTLTPYAQLTVTDPQGMHQATMSAADFATVDGILRGEKFRQDAVTGFTCPVSSATVIVMFATTRGGAGNGGDVTGCVLGGPAGTGAVTLYDVMTAY